MIWLLDLPSSRDKTGEEIAKTVSGLDAAYLLDKAWRLVNPETVKNCFKKALSSEDAEDSNSSAEEVASETRTITELNSLVNAEDNFLESLDFDDDIDLMKKRKEMKMKPHGTASNQQCLPRNV